MQSLICVNNQLQYVTDYPLPVPGEGEVRVRVNLAGICSTDLEIVHGYVPNFQGVLGHEFVGVVDSPGSAWNGRRVVSSISRGCGSCDVCRRHGDAHCPYRQTLGIRGWDGAFADYLVAPERLLFAVPDEVSDETAVFTEPLAAALRILEQVRMRPSAETAVIGPGRLGMLVAQVLGQTGTNLTVLGRSASSLALAARLGLPTGLAAEYPDNSFDVVVEVTGNEAGFQQALRLVRPLGMIILKSTFAGESSIDLTKVVVGEIQVVGSRCGPFAPALRMLAQGAIDVQSLMNATYAMSEGEAAFAYAARRGVLKVFLRP